MSYLVTKLAWRKIISNCTHKAYPIPILVRTTELIILLWSDFLLNYQIEFKITKITYFDLNMHVLFSSDDRSTCMS